MAYADQKAGGNRFASILLVVLLHIGMLFGAVVAFNYEAIRDEIVKTTVINVEEEVPEDEPPPPPDPDTPPPPPDVYVPPAVINTPSPVQIKTTNEITPPVISPCPGGQARNANGVCVEVPPADTFCQSLGRNIPANAQCPAVQECANGSPAPGNNINNCAERQPKPCPAGSVKSTVAWNEQCVKAGESRALQAQGNPGNWVPQSAYPRGPLRDGIEGTVGFTLSVGPDGRPTNCSVTSSSGNGELDSAACSNLMKRAKFKPKLENGQAVSASYSNRVRWVIPK